MPCVHVPRGFTDLVLPWDDAIDNNPCGKKIVTDAGGINYSLDNLCQNHLNAKYGLATIVLPIVTEP